MCWTNVWHFVQARLAREEPVDSSLFRSPEAILIKMADSNLRLGPADIRALYLPLIPKVLRMDMNVGPERLLELSRKTHPGTLGIELIPI